MTNDPSLKIYATHEGILLERGDACYRLPDTDWDGLFNRDRLADYLLRQAQQLAPDPAAAALLTGKLGIPMSNQELWASGVTYLRSKQGRQEESAAGGGADFYQKVYEAERPELFFKATAQRVAAHGEAIRIRADSTWDVPEPELVLAVNAHGKIIGYTIGNDVSSRSIEGENPLYLPQAKVYDGCAALGPCVLVTDSPLPDDTRIHLAIHRGGAEVFADDIAISQITRKFEDLVEYLYRECSFPFGAFLMTGTGIVPDSDFTLATGDEVTIRIDGIGMLRNTVNAGRP